jgi:FkbH-like protein
LSHADQVAAAATRLLLPAPPKKGIISDLDDTLWAGIAGEVGPDGVGWDLAGHNQLHGLYQTLLAALSEQGTLIAVASKNDPSVVRKVFERSDLLLRPERIFPIEVHWQAKSGSVSRILETWNIGSDAVIFVDDSPMELAEVAAVHPEIETILFPNRDYDAGLATLRRLRDLCAKERVSHDDTIRLDSIRKGVEFQQQVSSTSTPEHFLAQLHAVLSFDFAAEDPRVLELVNKTNQFNLNGLRYTTSEWHKQCSQPGAICVAVAYEDKFGPLGTISVIQGVTQGQTLHVETWVMSCRAFSRRIEHQCLRVLFDRTGVDTIDFQFKSTAKNGPMRDFLTAIMGKTPDCPCFLSREIFDKYCPSLYHQTTEIGRTAANG